VRFPERTNHVGVAFAGFDETLVCRAHLVEILLDHELWRSAAFGDVSAQASDQADVGGSLTCGLIAIVDELLPRIADAVFGCRGELAELPASLQCADLVGLPGERSVHGAMVPRQTALVDHSFSWHVVPDPSSHVSHDHPC